MKITNMFERRTLQHARLILEDYGEQATADAINSFLQKDSKERDAAYNNDSEHV